MFKGLLVLLMCCVLFTGCSGQTENPVSGASSANMPEGTISASAPPGTTASNLMIDRTQIFDMDLLDESEKDNGRIVGLQFYQGEPVLIEVKGYNFRPALLVLTDGKYQKEGEDRSELYPDSGLYIRRVDGTRELLIPGARLVESIGSILSEEEKEKEINILTKNGFIFGGTWYVDGEGNCYYTTYPGYMGGTSVSKECFLKLDKSGELLYKTVLEPGFEAEGFGCTGEKMYVILGGRAEGAEVKRVVSFDSETGVLADTDAFVLQTAVHDGVNPFGWGEDGLYLYDAAGVEGGRKGTGIKKVNLSDGSVSDFLPFTGSAWTRMINPWKMRGFRVLEGGDIEALYFCDENNGRIGAVAQGTLERISMVEGERKTVILRAATIPSWLKLRAVDFNKTDTEYRVVLEELSTSRSADLADYARQTNVELSAGKGPDILCGSLIEDYLRGMLAQGMLLDLSRSLAGMGIREGDYLPAAFGSWREGDQIYGINVSLYPRGYKIRRDALPAGSGAPDIYCLTDALSERREDATFYAYGDAGEVLEMLLEGSEDLWGMVDWERGTCDFSGDLFARILEVAKRYGYDGKHRYQTLVRNIRYMDIYHFESCAELEAEGMTVWGALFDDGCHGYIDNSTTLAVNAASPRKEGALKFLGYLLGEKAQAELTNAVPVNRAALEQWIGNDLEKVADGKEYTYGSSYIDEGVTVKYTRSFTEENMTEVRTREYLEALENVRPLPYRTAPILDIVYTEAADYFSGSKSIEDVAEVIRNRVQLYLDENK